MTAKLQSALFPGKVTHKRLKPKQHRLTYHIYSLLIDLDELEALDRGLRLFSVDRFNVFSFYRKDRGDRSGSDLKKQVERSMLAAGVEPDGGSIRLLTMPRLLGWAFNPLSAFFCYGKDGALRAILWEVDNTFGERHGYMIPVETPDGAEIVQLCDKAFFVSPFMDMNLRYEFRVLPPSDKILISIGALDEEGLLLTARHLAQRTELTDAALLKTFFATPLLTLRVIGGIHWEAIKIWLKGVRLRVRPKPPKHSVSLVRNDRIEESAQHRKIEFHESV
ncbi:MULTISPECIES: DUF1365 domain-containing protein [unclassified Rhizobium]|uniref:DUF1365 domain-containing protein n=1 Tax=unclassified Rhizobium TaxID=2613769 RepID=UPI00161623F1|nr:MULTISPECIES: DUF1365 domain-containing protein [unclassified Rhizobium]MBB3320421.1 hypothetical protein [Rhizobium sp. BK181]MCS4096371.1 hypothetical protein [Rhizobium sp. BK176]